MRSIFQQWSIKARRLLTVWSKLWGYIRLVLGGKAFTVLFFRALGFSTTDYGMIVCLQLLGYFAISEGKRFSQEASRALILTESKSDQSTAGVKRSSDRKGHYPTQFKHPHK